MSSTVRGATLTEGPVRTHLLEQSVPMVWALLAMMGFYFVDTWFVSMLGTTPLAAISLCFPIVTFGTSIGIGLMAGTSSVVARAVGTGNPERVKRLASDAVTLAVAVAAALCVLGLVFTDDLLAMLGANERTLPLARAYLHVWLPGLMLLLPAMAVMGTLRATGRARLQSRMMLVTFIANAAVDPILIFGLLGAPRLELAGAAAATVASRLIITPWALRVLARHDLLRLRPPDIRTWLHSLRDIAYVAAPAAATNAVIPIAQGIATALVAQHGVAAVAGFGAANRIENLCLVPFYALSASIGPIVGQNLGARRGDRVAQAMRVSWTFCLGAGLVIAAALALSANTLGSIFTTDPDALIVSSTYLTWIPVSYGCAGVVMITNAALNGLGAPATATLVSLMRIAVLYLPFAYLASRLWGVGGIFAAYALANVAAALFAVWIWRFRQRTSPLPIEA